MNIDPSVWPTVSTLLDAYLDQPESSRAAWLDALGPEYADILPALRELVSESSSGRDLLIDTFPGFTMPGGLACFTPLESGSLVGPYRLIRELGRGGMSTVWLAERADESLKREVALKLPTFSVHNSTLAERFARERDVLAQLTHPQIARLYDAGIAASGQAYLALEYVQGEPITAYCDGLRMGLKARLELFLQVLHAVQYAHSNLIVHRDLKPSNILVTAKGEVRLLDFGIAKLLVQGEARETELTRAGGRALTPEYASPEQLTGGVISTATDVYALGVILYELLTSQRPYRQKRGTPLALETEILTADPVRPSQAGAGDAQAQARSANSKKLAAALKGDLDTIVLRALRKTPAERYGTPHAFAQDIERYLNGEPVLARPESGFYRARKFVLRNKLAVGAAAAVALALGIGLSVALWQAAMARRSGQEAFRQRDRALNAEGSFKTERNRAVESQLQAERERNSAIAEKQRAETEAAISRALSGFLQHDLLAQASANTQSGPDTKPDPDLKVRDALDRATVRIPGKFGSQPAVEASIRHTIGRTYMELGLFAEAQAQLERAVELRRRVLGPEHADTLSSMNDLAWLYHVQSKFVLAWSLESKVAEGYRRLRGNRHPDTIRALSNLSIDAGWLQHHHAAAQELLAMERKVSGDQNPDTLAIMHNLAVDYTNQGRYSEAEELYTRTLETKRRVFGVEHPSTLNSMYGLGVVYRFEGKYAQAEAQLTQVLDARRRTLGEQHADTLQSMYGLAQVYRAQGRYAEAEALLTPVLAARRRLLGRDKPDTIMAVASLGEVKLEQHKYDEAEAMLREGLEDQATALDTWRRYYLQSLLGGSLTGLGNYDAAEPLLLSGYEGLIERRDSIAYGNRSVLEKARGRIGELYEAWGKSEQAAEWRDKAPK
ncbi:MAG TPA: serine/threonine-protein kinase [Terriglobales bacterium]|nr:serine/threonine-protein kinase [Terriglobales bacterium]